VFGVVGAPGYPDGAFGAAEALDSSGQTVWLSGREAHPAPLGHEALCDRQADTAAGTGHDRDPACEALPILRSAHDAAD